MPEHGILGGYRVVRRLASGGMADVFLARTSRSPDLVALKVPREELRRDPEVCQLIRDEAALASLLRHPSIVSVIETGEDEGVPWIAMEYVDGLSLAGTLTEFRRQRRALPPGVALHVARCTATGLHHAHRLDVVHRDVSPVNILLGRSGIVKLCDFGIARTSLRSRHTTRGVIRGKLPYMAPEQASLAAVGPATDQFALGAVLFEMLAGTPLYADADDLALLARARAGDIPALDPVRDTVPGAEHILARMLARSPDDRYPDLAAVAADLEAFAGTAPEPALARLVEQLADVGNTSPRPVLATPTRRLPAAGTARQVRPARRSWRLAAVPVAIVAVVVLVAMNPGAPAPTRAPESPAAAPTSSAPSTRTVIVEAWEADGALVSSLRTLGPALLGERLLEVANVRPVFAFRFAEEGLAAPPTTGDAFQLRGRASGTVDAVAGVVELWAPDGRTIASWPLDGAVDRVPARIAEVATAIAARFGEPAGDQRPALPLAGERLRRAALRAQGDVDRALGLFRELAVRYPDDPAAYLWAGSVAWWHGGEGLASIEDLEQLARTHAAPPVVIEALSIMHGFVADGEQRWRAAAESLITRFPDEPFAWLLAGEARLPAGDITEAADLLARFGRAEPLFARNNWRRFELARTRGDAETLAEIADLEPRIDPLADDAARRSQLRMHAALGRHAEAAAAGLALLASGGGDPEIVAETALALSVLGREDEAASLLDARAGSAAGARPVHLAALALCRAANDVERCRDWSARATPGGLGRPMRWPDGDLRFAASARLLYALTGDVTAWESDVARLRARAASPQGRDRRLLSVSDAAVAFHAGDLATLDALAAGERADAARFAGALAYELRGDLAGALAGHAAALAARPDGTFAAITSHAAARVARALGQRAEMERYCDEVSRPRVLSPYFAVLTAECRRWSVEAAAEPQRSPRRLVDPELDPDRALGSVTLR